jgi:hypothetical protein
LLILKPDSLLPPLPLSLKSGGMFIRRKELRTLPLLVLPDLSKDALMRMSDQTIRESLDCLECMIRRSQAE